MFSGQIDVDLEEIKSLFTYERISVSKRLSDSGANFFSFIESFNERRKEKQSAFIKFSYIGEDPLYRPILPQGQTVFPPGGWKLHIAVEDRMPENVARAWNIVKDILIEQRIAESKVITPGLSFANDQTQCGKQITIYQFYNQNRDWTAIINTIESRLIAAGIQPARLSPFDKPVAGSRFITYRNDLSKDGQHVITAEAAKDYPLEKRFNPFDYPNPFANIIIKPQLELTGDPSSKPQ